MDSVEKDFKNSLHKKLPGLKKVSSLGKCQVILLFCPIISRAGTDIDAAMKLLDQAKDSTAVIMVILHTTFDPEKIVLDSNNVITRDNTFAVDCLIYDNKLLECQKNKDAIDKTANYLKSKNLISYYCLNSLNNDHGNQIQGAQIGETHPLMAVPDLETRQEEDSYCFQCWRRLRHWCCRCWRYICDCFLRLCCGKGSSSN